MIVTSKECNFFQGFQIVAQYTEPWYKHSNQQRANFHLGPIFFVTVQEVVRYNGDHVDSGVEEKDDEDVQKNYVEDVENVENEDADADG